jgi:hypothetical protein
LVKEARHIFEERQQQEDLIHAIGAWVEREYGIIPAMVSTEMASHPSTFA